jgi:hypothetical protein
MKTIISFLIYSAGCLWAIIHLEPIYAIIIVTILTVIYAYCMIKGVHPNNEYIREYKRLRECLSHKKVYNGTPFICWLLRDSENKFPKWFQNDVRKRLMNLSKTHPYLLEKNINSEYLMDIKAPLWRVSDFNSRFKFIDTILDELRQERYQDRHL